ncbi:putative ccch zinc finger domain protein [Erysiphe necator]|uniref:Putative ccch zinc finger domain protein n=1 Tax=Uncinula necator TaxID=52586 RepID=A0A0B1PEQ0_UNCNE|nr:putative ccch zinc finger domain protein [Erysiphe necator]
MFCAENFEDIFDLDQNDFYNDNIIISICDNRKTLQMLFIDRIMKILGIKKPHRLYPPKSSDGLKNLHNAVIETNGTDHYKLSVFFYVLLEFDRVMSTCQSSEVFVQKSFLPKKYQTLIKGLWHMDHQEFEVALQYLAHPSLIPSFPDEIIEVLCKASKDDPTLPIAYYHSVQPALSNQQTVNYLLKQLARKSVTEAFFFTRTRNECFQQATFELLIHLVLDQSPGDVGEKCLELINLPFTSQEEVWFEEYLLLKDGRTLKGAKDVLMMRSIGTCKFNEFLSLNNPNIENINGVNWNLISNAVFSGLGPRVSTEKRNHSVVI